MYYNDNLARKYEYSANVQKSSVTLGKSHAEQVKQRVTMAKFLAVILFFVVGAGILLSKNAQVTEQKNKVADLKKEYNTLVHENKKAEIEINQKIDLKTVEEIAISNYNMNRAKKSQVVYIDVQQEDYAVINGDVDAEEEKNSSTSSLVAYLQK